MTRVAAFDCGTNTLKLLVADVDPGTGDVRDLLRDSRLVRLGEGVDGSGRLAGGALARVFAAVEELAALVADHAVDVVRFCATSAARDAVDTEPLLAGVRARLGVAAEVLTGQEEARLTFIGAAGPLPRAGAGDPVLVVDVGGGSTELVLGRAGQEPEESHSADVGSVRLTERHLHGDPPRPAEVEAAQAVVVAALDEAPVELARARTVVAVSGTALTLGAATLGLREDLPQLAERLDGAVLPVADVRATARELLAMRVAERRRMPFMPPLRADVIGAGALILDAVLARTDVPTVRISVRDILDGIAWAAAVGAAGR